MARTESTLDAALVELDAAGVAAGTALSDEAGWNQTAEDWALMIRLGRAFGVRGADGHIVATALALPYPPRFGWISMVLVHGRYRRRGLASRLLERSVVELSERSLVPFLDATPAGRAVYERLGFGAVSALTRWRGLGRGRAQAALPRLAASDLGALGEFDEAAFGADRSQVLADLLRRGSPVALRDPAGEGFLLSRAGRTATHVGPVVARETEIALTLLEDALDAITGPALIDVPDRESELADLLRHRGFEPERPYVRMALGRETAFGDEALVRAIAGPELG
jgi:GNAT superfamily N-acetyltransferase